MLINSPNNNDAKISPNMEENDNTNTDLIIPNLFILIRKKYNDVPKPTAPSTTIWGSCVILIVNGIWNTNTAKKEVYYLQ